MLIDLIKENGFRLKKARSWWYPGETVIDAHYANDLVLFANTPAQAESYCTLQEQTGGGIGLHVNTNKTEYMCFKWEAISTLSGWPLKLVDKFTYLSSNISSTESDINICLAKVWTTIDRLSIIWKSDLHNND